MQVRTVPGAQQVVAVGAGLAGLAGLSAALHLSGSGQPR